MKTGQQGSETLNEWVLTITHTDVAIYEHRLPLCPSLSLITTASGSRSGSLVSRAPKLGHHTDGVHDYGAA